MAYTPVDIIEVRCWEEKVGAIALDPVSGYYAFEYYPEFRKSKLELAPLTFPLNETEPQVFPLLPIETYYRLPAFIADSLPDKFGNGLIDAWMARNGVSKSDVTALDRLAYMGTRGMGALEFRPALRAENKRPSAIEMKALVETARQAVQVDLTENPVENLAEEESEISEEGLSQLISVGTSAGGARAKAVVGWNEKLGRFMSGQFKLPKNYEHWLIKFDVPSNENPNPKRAYGRIEYAYYLMAAACGINMMPCRLFEANGRAHFMTKRFDRTADGAKLHTQTLCAMQELDFNQIAVHDYSQLFDTIIRLDLGLDTADEAFRRMVFNVCLANNDDHTKNHSFILRPDGKWELAPAYDLTYAYEPKNKWLSRHLMSVNGAFSEITREDLLSVARRFNIKTPDTIIDEILEISSLWQKYAAEVGLSKADILRIEKGITSACQSIHRISI